MNLLEFPLDWQTCTYVMGIINITADSFSGDGLLKQNDRVEAAVNQARQFVRDGAHILDVGGESTRPGASPVSAEEEMERVLPVIEALATQGLNVPISIDTYKASVAEVALEAGAHWVNDIWGLRADPNMAVVAARHKAPVILMHNRSKPAQFELQQRLGGVYVGAEYENLIEDVNRELMESVQVALTAGLPRSHIILDPGIGFGKTIEQNLYLINHLDRISELGYPVLLGPSRKYFIGHTLNLPADERVEGTAAAVSVGIQRGANIIRVHDVKTMSRVAAMTDAIIHCREVT